MRKVKKRQAEKEMKQKIGLFSRLEDFCLVCEKPFDKRAKKWYNHGMLLLEKKKGKLIYIVPSAGVELPA